MSATARKPTKNRTLLFVNVYLLEPGQLLRADTGTQGNSSWDIFLQNTDSLIQRGKDPQTTFEGLVFATNKLVGLDFNATCSMMYDTYSLTCSTYTNRMDQWHGDWSNQPTHRTSIHHKRKERLEA